MKNIIIAVLATTLFFVYVLLQIALNVLRTDNAKLNAPAPQDQITANSYESLMSACRGGLEDDGYIVNQAPNNYLLPQLWPPLVATGTELYFTTSTL